MASTHIAKSKLNGKCFLEKRYSKEMELEGAVHSALLALKEGFEGHVTGNNVEMTVVCSDA